MRGCPGPCEPTAVAVLAGEWVPISGTQTFRA